MTGDLILTLWVLFVCLAFGSLINLMMFWTAFRQWAEVVRERLNGSRQVLARQLVRRVSLRLLLFGTITFSIGLRITGHPPPVWLVIVNTLIILGALLGDSIGDMFDYRLLRAIWKADK